MFSIGFARYTPKALKVAFAMCLTAGMFLLAMSAPFLRSLHLPVVRQGPTEISGVVLTSGARTPLADALVAVESAGPGADNTTGSYLKTNAEGKFKAAIEGTPVSVRVWKQGYALNGKILKDASASDVIVIELRELAPTNLVSGHDAFYELRPGTGFSFSSGKVVGGGDPEADIVISQPAEDRTVAFIEARGAGGVIFQPYDDRVDFYNSPEAPQAGYKARERFDPSDRPSEEGLYFVRTRDGNHYAKFRLSVNFVAPSRGNAYLDFESAGRLIWAYQPDGTRNLEVAPGKGMPFPLYKFDLETEASN